MVNLSVPLSPSQTVPSTKEGKLRKIPGVTFVCGPIPLCLGYIYLVIFRNKQNTLTLPSGSQILNLDILIIE